MLASHFRSSKVQASVNGIWQRGIYVPSFYSHAHAMSIKTSTRSSGEIKDLLVPWLFVRRRTRWESIQ
jgi:hypothetical protein